VSTALPDQGVGPVRVIFLDFDGVIMTYRTLMASEVMGWSNADPDPMLCALLRRVCATGVGIVVSSSWRDAEETCKAKLKEGDLLRFLHDDWRTPHMYQDGQSAGSRSREVADWLTRHPEVADYRILDDDHFQWTPEQTARWIECSAYDGMPAMAMKDLAEWAGLARTKKPLEIANRANLEGES
jgi:hypothetical protein